MTLYSPSGSALRSSRSRPEPNAETEQRVREQLQSMDNLLDIMWFPHAVYNERHKDFEGRYALVCKWPNGDNRWALYQTGEIDLPYDMFGWFTETMDAESVPVSPDAIEHKVMELLLECDDERIPHAKRMGQILGKNAKVRKARQQEMIDQAGEIARDLHYIAGHRETVSLERIMKEIAKEGMENG